VGTRGEGKNYRTLNHSFDDRTNLLRAEERKERNRELESYSEKDGRKVRQKEGEKRRKKSINLTPNFFFGCRQRR